MERVLSLNPCPFPQKDKHAPFFLKDLPIIIIKLESNEIRKIPVIFLPFLDLNDIISSDILIKKILNVHFFVD